MGKLKNNETRDEFRLTLQNRYAALHAANDTPTVEGMWSNIKRTYVETCEAVLGKRERRQKPWMRDDTWIKIEERKTLKDRLNQARTRNEKIQLQKQYSEKAHEVKTSIRSDKRKYTDDLATTAEDAAARGDIKLLYSTTKQLSGRYTSSNKPLKDRDGKLVTEVEEQLRLWREHFKKVLNSDPPNDRPDLRDPMDPLDIRTDAITKGEIQNAIKKLKTGKAAGIDNVPPEAIKEGGQFSVNILHPLLDKIWNDEEIPADWKKGLLVKLPKKGDLSQTTNWRGITLLSIPSKILTRVMLDRMKDALDSRLRDEQAGFRKERSCTDQIATLRMIIEQSIEWNSSLYMNFVDFRKAFDSVDRDVAWKILRHYGLPEKFINIIKTLHNDFSCQVIHNGSLTEPFDVTAGVRQGCLLSPLIFLVVLDWVTRTAYGGAPTGIRWTFQRRLDDLEYADDLCLLAHRLQDIRQKTESLSKAANQVGLHINAGKTKVMRVHSRQVGGVSVDGNDLEDVNEFTYLGSLVSTSGGTDEDIKARIKKARQVFAQLRPIWKSRIYSLHVKLRIFNSNVKSVLLYGSETWRITKTLVNRVQVFVNGCLRRILNIRWFDRVSNKTLWERASQDGIEIQIRRRKWRWIGHTLRKPDSNTTKMALEWNPQGQRRRGRPTQTWRRTSTAELKSIDMTWRQSRVTAGHRVRWRAVVEALCNNGCQEE